MSEDQKDFSSVSPSALSLLLMKGYTTIPYAPQLAALMQGPEVFGLDQANKDFWFWIRVMHFESRYRSIDQLLQQTDNTNMLELSSGYSLRGLALCAANERIHYIDTDLADVVTTKQRMIDHMHVAGDAKGRYELLPLNVLNTAAFNDVVSRFANGPITIVNEGLLMYLDMEEKKRLCIIMHHVLMQRGGCWITADVYVKRGPDMQASIPQTSSEQAFFQQHHIEENKFDSYEAAQIFFKEQGFELVQEAQPNYAALSVMPELMKVLPEEVRNSKEPPPKVQATWMLRAV